MIVTPDDTLHLFHSPSTNEGLRFFRIVSGLGCFRSCLILSLSNPTNLVRAFFLSCDIGVIADAMKTAALFSLILSPVLAFSEPPAPPPSAPDAATLTQLLNEFLDGAAHNDVAMHERFWADELIYTRSTGQRLGKADILRDMKAEAAAPKKSDEGTTAYGAEDIRILQYGTTAVVAFRLVATTKKGETTEIANYFNTGTFVKRDNKWKAVAWQATKIPAQSEPKR